MAQHIVAIDVSATGARVAVIEASLRRASLLMLKTIPLPEGLAPADAWPLISEQLPKPLDSVVVGLDPRTTSARELVFPFGDLRKAETAVDFELEGQIPYPMEEVAVTSFVSQRTPAETRILAAITPKAPLIAYLTSLSAAGLEPRAAVLPAAALSEFLPVGSPDNVALISLGASHSHVAMGRNGLRFVRTLRAGGDDIDRVLAKRFNVSLDDARGAKESEGRILNAKAGGSDHEKSISNALEEGLRPLLMGLIATFKSVNATDAPQRLLLTGGLSRLMGLPEYLADKLGMEVQLLDLGAATQVLPGEAARGPEYAVALAMAIALWRHGRDTPLNFRRGDFAYHGDIQLYRGQLTRIASGLVAVFLLAIFASVVRYSVLRADERQLDQGFCAATQRIVGREICDPTAALATLRQAPGAEGATIPSFSAAALLEMMSKAVTTDVDVQFDEIDLRVEGNSGQAERLSGKGEAASFESTEQLVAMLKRDACVQDAEVSKLRKTRNSGRVEFALLIKVACPIGVQPGTKLQALHPATPAAAPAPAGPR